MKKIIIMILFILIITGCKNNNDLEIDTKKENINQYYTETIEINEEIDEVKEENNNEPIITKVIMNLS